MAKTTLRSIMVRAHEIARTFEGDYVARLSAGLRQAWAEHKAPTTKKGRKSHLDVIIECLDAGLELSIWDGGRERKFTAGQITRQRTKNGGVMTTHTMTWRGRPGMPVIIKKSYLPVLAEQARKKLARKDEILAQRERRIMAALGF